MYKDGHKTWTSEYQRLHYPEGPCCRCSIHNRPTCAFSSIDSPRAEHGKGPRPVRYEIKLRLRRFGYGTIHPARQNDSYIGLPVPYAPRGLATARPHALVHSGTRPGPATISALVPSPWTLARSFVSSSTDLREVQINNIQTRAWAAQSTLLAV